jgi:hypothetical protein
MSMASFFDGWWGALIVLIPFFAGSLFGRMVEARQWREKGDHEYMNTKESGGWLYTVKREQ